MKLFKMAVALGLFAAIAPLLAGCVEGDTKDEKTTDADAGLDGGVPPGSAVPAGYVSEARFGPAAPERHGDDFAPRYPVRLLHYPQWVARQGQTLYVSDAERGVMAFDVSDPMHPVFLGAVFVDGRPRWIGVDEGRLMVIAEMTAEDLEAAEQGGVTRVLTYDVDASPGAPLLIGEAELPGKLRAARLRAGRLLTLSAVIRPSTCDPAYGYYLDWQPEAMAVSAFVAAAEGMVLSDQVTVPGEGVIETETAFVLTTDVDASASTTGALTVVDLSSAQGGLTLFPTVVLSEPLDPDAPCGFENTTLSFFTHGDGTPTLNVVLLSASEVTSHQTLALPESSVPSAAGFGAGFALVPSSDAAVSGIVVALDDAIGPAAVAELPAGIAGVIPLGKRWLGIGAEEVTLFSLDADGAVSVQGETAAPLTIDNPGPGARFPSFVYDAAAEQVLVPYINYDTSTSRLGRLDVSEGGPIWGDGLETIRYAGLTAYSAASYHGGTDIIAADTSEAVSFVLTDGEPVMRFGANPTLEALDFAAAKTAAVAIPHARDVALTGDFDAQLIATLGGGRAVVLDPMADNTPPTQIALAYAVDTLTAFNGDLLAYGGSSSNSCSEEEMEEHYGPCTADGQPAISRIGLKGAPRLIAEIPLPSQRPTLPEDVRVSSGWLALVTEGEQVGVIQHRSTYCRTAAACDALGISYEVLEQDTGPAEECDEEGNCETVTDEGGPYVQGNRDERWIYPFDIAANAFGAPILLGETGGYGSVSGAGIVDDVGLSLLQLTPTEMNDAVGEIIRARLELLRFRSILDASSLERIPMRGFPMRVRGDRVVTIEPSGPLGEGSGAVGTDVHLLQIQRGTAYLVQTLSLGAGHADHLWADEVGYVLLVPDDRCASPRRSEIVSIRLTGDALTVGGRLALPGTGWRLVKASDRALVLEREISELSELAVIDVAGDALSLRETRTVPRNREYDPPVALFGNRVAIGTD